jgi:hypothetical protein
MDTYPVDIDAAQVVRWLNQECAAAPSIFRITGRRGREIRAIPFTRETHLDDEDRADLTEIATVATLEIAPAHGNEGWQLIVVVEDELGPRIAEGDGEQAIDLRTFYGEFIRPGRGFANVYAEVDGPVARARLQRLLEQIECDRHAPDGRPPRRPAAR